MRPAAAHPNVTLWTNARAERLITDPSGRTVEAIEIAREDDDFGRMEGAYSNLAPVVGLPGLEELNIGHGIVARAILIGMHGAGEELRVIIDRGGR